MALTEAEELELLELEEEEYQASLANQPVQAPSSENGGFMRSALKSPALPIIGGILGTPGGPAGVALGAAGGEAWRQIGARSMGLPSPSTSLEAAKYIAIEGATQGIGQGSANVGMKLAAPVFRGVGRMVKQPLGDIFQLITKIKPEYAKTLFENPKSILPGQMKKAQAAWRAAAKKAGLPVDEASPKLLKALKTDARNTVFDTFKRIKSGKSVSAADAQIAKQALDIALMPAAKNEKNSAIISIYGKMRKVFTERIGQESPKLAAANKKYAIAKAGEKFKSFFPRNQNDSPAYFRSGMLPSLLTGAGALRGEPMEGALEGAGVAALTSPAAFGTGIALAGGPARLAAPYVGRAAVGALAELTKKKLQRK